ncbi:hypothetical protein [Azotosporobacter soli]|uniref:hypothetical protein n=1 Tax=Azotosporobacter soli TaxID=3055040 RepID=UPI0031FEE946
MQEKLKSVQWGVILAIATIFLGFFLGAAMGGAEAQIKQYWTASAQPVLSSVYNNDAQKVSAIVDRSWKMLQRAHMHAAAIGSASLILLYVLSCLNLSALYKKTLALFLGLGSLGYSLSWLYTAFAAPLTGSIPAAKASIHILAAGSIGMLLAGTFAILALSCKTLLCSKNT